MIKTGELFRNVHLLGTCHSELDLEYLFVKRYLSEKKYYSPVVSLKLIKTDNKMKSTVLCEHC